MNWKDVPVVVTGAGGFIGSHLTERLVRLGARTRALVHYRADRSWGWLDTSPLRGDIEVVAGDICDRDSVVRAMRGVDAVFHLAALVGIPYSYDVPYSYVRTNVEGTLQVLQSARELGVGRVVHTSTSEVYGTARYVPIDEKHPLQAQSPYAASKIAADKLAESFFLAYGLPVVTVRPFNTFGPRQSLRAVVPTIVSQCLLGTVVRLGNLLPKRDLNYVGDIVEGFVLAASSDRALGQTLNLGSGREIGVRELAELIAKLLGHQIQIEVVDRRKRPESSEVERLLAGSAAAKDLLGWAPKTSLEEGIAQTAEWMRANNNAYVGTDYVV